VTELQLLFNRCLEVFCELDLHINIEKSNCLRIGNRCHSFCKQICVNGISLNWASEAKYLGITIKSSVKFVCNWQHSRGKFYKSVNGILGVLGSNSSVDVVLALIRANCIPVLTYAIATLALTSNEVNHLTYAYNNIFCKLFKTTNIDVIEQCQYYCSFWPFYALYEYHRFVFLVAQYNNGLISHNNTYSQTDFSDLQRLATKYKFEFSDAKYKLKCKIWNYLESKIN